MQTIDKGRKRTHIGFVGPAGTSVGTIGRLQIHIRETGCQFPDSGEPEGMPGRADMGRRPAKPRDRHYSIEFE